jgi:hypothetical protein
VIENIIRWGGEGIPLTVDGTYVVKCPPVEFLPGHHFLEFTRIMVPGIDADEDKWLVFEIRYERPLVSPSGPSGQSEFTPEIQQHDLAPIVAQFE